MGFDEGKFAEYLLYDVLVRKGTEVYYIYWVRQFLRGYDPQSDLDWQGQLKQFLQDLREGKEFQEWQANQAERAVRTYFTGFKKLSVKTKPAPESPREQQLMLSADSLLVQFKENLRSQKCGASTERIYLGWVRRYFDYLERDGQKSTFNRRDLEKGVSGFLIYLHEEAKEQPSVRKQAFNALMIFFSLVMERNISGLRYLLEK